MQKIFKELFNDECYQKSKNYVACVDKITDLNARDKKKYQFTKPKKDISLWMLQRLVRTKQEITQSHTTEALKCNEREIKHYKLSKRSLADSIQGLSIGTAVVRLRQFLLIRSRYVELGMCYWDNFRCFRDKLDYETHLKFAYINP